MTTLIVATASYKHHSKK